MYHFYAFLFSSSLTSFVLSVLLSPICSSSVHLISDLSTLIYYQACHTPSNRSHLPLSYLPFPSLALPYLVDYKSSAEGRTRDFPVLLASERYDCSYFPLCPFLNMTCVRCHTDSSTPYILQCLTMPHCPDLLCSALLCFVLPLTFPIIPHSPCCISPSADEIIVKVRVPLRVLRYVADALEYMLLLDEDSCVTQVGMEGIRLNKNILD
jgi:hypothetical protein